MAEVQSATCVSRRDALLEQLDRDDLPFQRVQALCWALFAWMDQHAARNELEVAWLERELKAAELQRNMSAQMANGSLAMGVMQSGAQLVAAAAGLPDGSPIKAFIGNYLNPEMARMMAGVGAEGLKLPAAMVQGRYAATASESGTHLQAHGKFEDATSQAKAKREQETRQMLDNLRRDSEAATRAKEAVCR